MPKYVFERIQEERNRFEFAKDDEFWICIDRDRWTAEDHIKNLTQVLQQCKQSNIQIAFCNPCFEFWLLLHFLDPKLDQCLSCSSVTASLKKIASGYSKTLVSRQPITSEMVNEACLRAKSLDPAGEALPASPAANVYLIIESIKCRIRDDIHLH